MRNRIKATAAGNCAPIVERLESRRLLSNAPEPTGLAGYYHIENQLSTPRTNVSTLAAGNDLLFAGGETTTAKGGAVSSDVVDIFNAATGEWSVAHLSSARYSIQTFAIGGIAIFVGGYDTSNDGINTTVDIYNTTRNTWSSRDLDRDLQSATVVTVGDKLVIAGGFTDSARTQLDPSIDVYDTATGLWRTAQISQPRTQLVTAVVGTTLLLAGGYIPSGTSTETPSGAVDIFNATSGSWSSTSLSAARSDLTVASVGAYAIFAGGDSSSDPTHPLYTNSVDIFDSATGQWSTRQIGSDTGDEASAGAFGTQAVVWTGTETDVFDSVTGQWTEYDFANGDAAGPYLSGYHPIALLGDKLVFEANSSYGPIFNIPVLDLATGQTTDHQLQNAHQWAFVMGQTVTLAGGEGFDGGYQGSNELETYNAATNSWSVISLSSDPTDGVVFQGRLCMADGSNVVAYDSSTSSVTLLQIGATSNATSLAMVGNDLLAYEDYAYSDPVQQGVDLYTTSDVADPTLQDYFGTGGLNYSPASVDWEPGLNATSYNVYVDDQLVANTTDTSYPINTPLDPGFHSFQVVATDGSNFSPSAREAFVIGLPAAPSDPSVPDKSAPAASPTELAWAPAAGATSYAVYLDGVRLDRTAATSITLNEPVIGGNHIWAVVAYNAVGSSVGPAWTFSTPQSGLIHASHTLDRDQYVWTPVALTVGNTAVYASTGAESYSNIYVYNGRTKQISQSQLQEARSGFACVSVGDLAMFAGGSDNDTTTSATVDIYDVSSGAWSQAALSQGRTLAVAASARGIAAFAGGTVDSANYQETDSAVVDLYNSQTAVWTTAKLSQARTVAAGVAAGADILFAGGDTGNNASDVVDIFNTTTGRWSTASLSQPSESLASATVGNRAYFAGAQSLDVYDAASNRWASVATPAGLSQAVTCVQGRLIYFIGLYSSSDVYVFDTRTGRWSTTAAPDSDYQAATLLGSELLLFGPDDIVDELNTQSGVWAVQKLRFPASGGVAPAVVDNVAIVVSNDIDNVTVNDDLFYSLAAT